MARLSEGPGALRPGELQQPFRQRPGVEGVDDVPGDAVLDDLRHRAPVASHAREPVGHRLQERHSERLVDRRHREHRRVPVEGSQPALALRGARDPGVEAHAGLRRRRFVRPDDPELGVGSLSPYPPEGLQQLRAALPLPAHAAEQDARRGEGPLRGLRHRLEIGARADGDDLVGGLAEVVDERPAQPVAHREDQLRPVVEAALGRERALNAAVASVEQRLGPRQRDGKVAVVVRAAEAGAAVDVGPGSDLEQPVRVQAAQAACRELSSEPACERARRRGAGVVAEAPAAPVGREARRLLEPVRGPSSLRRPRRRVRPPARAPPGGTG